ncbi:MFS transporter [Chloroflexota bacterium]
MEYGTAVKKFNFRTLFSGILPLFVLAHFVHHAMTALTVPLLPLIRDEFALDYTRAGFATAAFHLPYGISQLPSGWLADRFGRRVMIAVSVCGVALAGLLVGLSQTYIMLIVFLALMGVLGGGYHPAATPAVSESVPLKNQSRALGLHMIGGSASYFLVPLLAAALATAWNWRGSFIALAVPAAVAGIVLYILLGKQTAAGKAGEKIADSHQEQTADLVPWRRMLPFIVLTTFNAAVILAVVSFIPLFAVDNFGIGEAAAAALVALVYSAGLWAAPLGGYFADRFGKMRVVLAVCLISGPVFYLLDLVSNGLWFYALLLAIGVLVYFRAPASDAYIISGTSERRRSTVIGICYFFVVEGAGVLTPLVGYLIDRFGFSLTFTVTGAALSAVALVCSVFLWNRRG